MRLVVVAAAAFATVATQYNATAPAAIAKLIEHELAAARVPGAAIAIVKGGELFAGGYGLADAESGAPVTPATLMHVGSLTKLFTALGVVAALDAAGVPADAVVGRFVSGLDPRVADRTFHELLSQTSGLRDRPGGSGSEDEAALLRSVRELTPADFVLPAGIVFSYTNLGYALAGAGLEALAKKPFADALRDFVLTPLGMEQSTVRLPEALARSHAVGHRLEGAKTMAIRPPTTDTRIAPAGYLWTNATDMSRALSVLMAGQSRRAPRGLKPEIVMRVLSAKTALPNVFPGGHYGYGVMLARDRGVDIYEHGGTLPGFSSILRVAPSQQLGIVILTNLENAPLRRIAQTVMGKVLDLPEARPVTRRETPVSAEEMKPFVGRYENRGTAEIAIRDGRAVFILDDGAPLTVSRIGENRYLARPKPEIAGPEFVLQPATASAPRYLHFALWGYTAANK